MKANPTLVFASAPFPTVGHIVLVTNDQSMVRVIALKRLCSVCSGFAVSSNTKYHTHAILHELVNNLLFFKVKIATLAQVFRLCADHVRGENSPGGKYVVKELNSK